MCIRDRREIDVARSDIAEAESNLETIRQSRAELIRIERGAQEDIKDLEARREDIKLAIETIERRLIQTNQDFVRAETRLKESFGKAVEAIMAAKLAAIIASTALPKLS